MAQVGIIGAGVAGIQLALFLQQHGVETMLYAERTPDEQRKARLPNTAAHFGATRARERELGVNHWDTPDLVATHINIAVGPPLSVGFRGQMDAPFQLTDQRMYLAQLFEDYLARGGHAEIRTVTPAEVEGWAAQHELLVIATGRGGLGDLFPVLPEHSPLDHPVRNICTAFYTGVAPGDGTNPLIHLLPGHGELFDLPINSFDGRQQALYFEAIPGGALEVLAGLNYTKDPVHFERTVLAVVREHFPAVYDRITPAQFGVTRPLDILQGAITPRVRRGYTQLPNGRWIVAIGDARIVHDPVAGQGANAASQNAFALGQAILDDVAFDEYFCRKVERRIWDHMEGVTAWALAILAPPPDHVLQFLGTAAQNQAVADAFANGFNRPNHMWDIICTPQRTARFLSQFSARSIAG